MTFSPRQELFCWLVGALAVVGLFLHSNAFKLTLAASYHGLAMLLIVALLFWLKFRKKPAPEPKWLRILATVVLVIVTATFLLYAVGIATWYE